MKLFTRYNRINSLVTLAIFLVTSFTYYFLIRQVLIMELDQNLVRIRNRMQAYVDKQGMLPGPQLLDDLKVYYSAGAATSPGAERYESTHFYDSTLKKVHRFRKLFFPLQVQGTWYQVTLVKPLEGTRHVTDIVVFTTIAVTLSIILCSLLINRVVLRRLWAPFYRSLEALGAFQLGERLSPVFEDTSIDEFSMMNRRLKEATGKAAEDYRILKEFTENASHEIQTPLAILRSKLDLVIQDEGLSDRQGESLRSAYGALKKMSRLNQSLLLITKIENDQYNRTADIALHETLGEKLLQFQELWENSGLRIAASVSAAHIHASPELMDILLDNLLSNATRYNLPGGSMAVTLSQGLLEVTNTGTPSPLDRDRLFQRFYKETPDSDRVGLGLSIIKQICVATGIAVAYDYADGRHVFRLTWGPAAR